ncbi:MAG TPA: phosphosulfolactate synthase [Clostridia bacterium]|nr:phosphosulfolactate synthase [Clostridia bacterium]HHY06420.1 phosphosulfolactate synthase [Clostridia bacterium]
MPHNWKQLITYPLGERTIKPREKGVTMVLDKGLGLRELQDLLEVAGDYLDFLKLGFGTSLLYKQELLQAKIKLCQAYQVEIYPGGTLMEIALRQGKYKTYLEQIQKLGFKTIEISDGTITLSTPKREDCIKQAVNTGFRVLSELGKKNLKNIFSPRELWKQGETDLKNGAWKVIIEARESGKGIGIYNHKGEIEETKLKDLLKYYRDHNQIIWEAPLKKQQIALIHKLGPEVNLGNIQPPDLLALEALRTGLRADTLSLNPEICSS